jgi:cation-transporting ATPase I
MSGVVAEEPYVLSRLAGRIRVSLPGWSGREQQELEARVRQLPGVARAQANGLTGNVLIYFDPAVTSAQTVLYALRTLNLAMLDRSVGLPRPRPDDNMTRPGQAHTPIERAREAWQPGSPTQEAGTSHPAHAPNTGALVQGTLSTTLASVGLGVLTIRRLLRVMEPLPAAPVAAEIADVITAIQSVPFLRYGLRKLLGNTTAGLLLNLSAILTQALSSKTLSLTVREAQALRLLTEAVAVRGAWRRSEEQSSTAPIAQPGKMLHLEAGERAPLAATVVEGTGIALGQDGLPLPAVAGSVLPPGARLFGGPFAVRLQDIPGFPVGMPRPAAATPSFYHRYLKLFTPLSLAYTLAVALRTRSWQQTLSALLRFNPRTAMVGKDNADLGAYARAIRAGVTVLDTEGKHTLQRPDVLFVDGTRLLTHGLEMSHMLPLTEEYEGTDLLAQAASVAAAAGLPWGTIFRGTEAIPAIPAAQGSFDGTTATASLNGTRYTLGPVTDWGALPQAAPLRHSGHYVLVLSRGEEQQPRALLALRPRLASGLDTLVQTCHRCGVELKVNASGDELVARAIAAQAQIALLQGETLEEAIRAKQRRGARVACVSDSVGAATAFALCDLSIGLAENRRRLPTPVDLLAPDLAAVAAIIEAGARRNAAERDGTWLALLSNLVGLLGTLQEARGQQLASQIVSLTSLGTLADSWLRMRGGERAGLQLAALVDPHPERWGQRSIEQVALYLHTSPHGLSSTEAANRRQAAPIRARRRSVLSLLLEQVRSPLIITYAASAAFSLFLGAPGDAIIITTTIFANVAVGVWQEYKANRVTEALENLGTATAQVLRNGKPMTVRATNVVPGDVLLLAAGNRVVADARVMNAHGLEVDEAALTGESLPVAKAPAGGSDMSRVVLEGSDVTAGTGQAIVVAVGRQTRMGATAAALSVNETEQSPLGVRLNRLLHVLLPLSVAGGGLVLAVGLFRRQPLAAQLALGVTVVLAVIPEGLPLLASLSEAAVARRLAGHAAMVRRLSAVEALGRVDVACTDKTGTLTQGQLAVSLIADTTQEVSMSNELPPSMSHILLTAALASPSPDAPDVSAHPTDTAIVQAAQHVGFTQQLREPRRTELAFDPVRGFYITQTETRLCLKGAPEVLVARCRWQLRDGERIAIDELGQQQLLTRANQLAAHGLRLLMVAEGVIDGVAEGTLNNPDNLTALGFVGISDPLRPTVRATVRRCRDAGVRVIMITGDHPATAHAIAHEAGLFEQDGTTGILSGAELLNLDADELDRRLAHAAVIARATPLDKLKIIESLQRSGHTVAMTGDGVNDAPALRLADVGVAMGRGGTEVARQTADVVLADDDFSTLVEALVEGRSFWRNIRRSLGLLLGGNLGELGLVVGASLLSRGLPLAARQILAMNVITDLLPATAVALQQPEQRNLAGLAREGTTALDAPLRNDLLRRATSTALPSLASYLLVQRAGMPQAASTVAFGSIITTQLAQTLAAGRAEGHITPSVLGAVAASGSVLVSTLTVPPLRTALQLVPPPALGWLLIGAGAPVAVLLNRGLALASSALNGT